jgi:hypothetical protein
VHEAKALATGNYRDRHSVLSVAEGIGECIALASIPLDQRPKPISTGIPSLDLDRRGGVIPGKGEGTWVLACSGKFAIAGPLRTHGTGSATPSYGKTPTATGRRTESRSWRRCERWVSTPSVSMASTRDVTHDIRALLVLLGWREAALAMQ